MGKGDKKIKLCYVLPEYSEDLASHIFYLYDFIYQAAERADIYLIVEKSSTKKLGGPFKEVHVQRYENSVLRWLENFILIISARLKGYRNFYVHYSYFGAINSIIISKLTGARSYYWSCGMMWLFEMPFKLRLVVIKSKLKDEWPLKFILKNIDFLVTGNETMKREYCRHYKLAENMVKVMPNWIDFGRFDPDKFNSADLKKKYNIPADKKIVLFVHRLSERKGADLLPSIAQGFKGLENVMFIVCGSGPLEGFLRQQIKRRGLEDILRLEGKVPNKLIPEYFAMADVFLMPSREEGFPRVLLESMAMNVPYVASNVGGIKEMTPDSLKINICANPADVNCYLEKIKLFLGKDNFFLRDLVKKYSTQNVSKIFIELFS